MSDTLVSAALAQLAAHRLRSLLTTLGIMIGTMAVVAVVSILQGFADTIRTQFADFGSGSLRLAVRYDGRADGAATPPVSFDDIDALRYRVEGVGAVAPFVIIQAGPITWKSNSVEATVFGTTEDAQLTRGYFAAEGRFLTASDDQGARAVAVIGTKIRDDLGMPADPVGEFILIGGRWFKVVGLLERRGDVLGMSQDELMFIPFSTARSLSGTYERPYMEASFTALRLEDIGDVRERAVRAVRASRRIPPGEDDDFVVEAADSFVKQFNRMSRNATAVFAGIVGLSLLVGGIGIMNVMLVSVTERTREIGVLKALGARRNDIVMQFLLEASLLSLAGGLLGIVLGIVVGTAVTSMIPGFPPASVPPWLMLAAAGFSALIGIVFGVFPAWKAASLDPVEALRYE